MYQYGKGTNNEFRYEVINVKSVKLPKTIVLSNDEIESMYIKKSNKKDLIYRLKKENYKKIAEFKPNFKYFKLINNEFDFHISGFAMGANEISVYNKK